MEMIVTTYTVEKLKNNLEDVDKLSKLHYMESCPYDDIPLRVDWNKFLRLEKLDILKMFVMRKNTELVGYAFFTVIESLEYSTSLQASLSNIYIHQDHRGNGGAFILWCDEQLRDMKVQVVYHHVKAKNDYGVLLKRLGYDIMNIEYAKRLDK